MAPPPHREGEKSLCGNGQICAALLCPPAPSPKSARARAGGATRSSSKSLRRLGARSVPLASAVEVAWLFLSPGAPGERHYPPANLHSGPRLRYIHSTARHSCFWSNNQSLQDNNARRGGRGRGGGGAASSQPRRRALAGCGLGCGGHRS